MALSLNLWVFRLYHSTVIAGVDTGDMNAEDVAELFGNTKGLNRVIQMSLLNPLILMRLTSDDCYY
jgi:hypothetical protein